MTYESFAFDVSKALIRGHRAVALTAALRPGTADQLPDGREGGEWDTNDGDGEHHRLCLVERDYALVPVIDRELHGSRIRRD